MQLNRMSGVGQCRPFIGRVATDFGHGFTSLQEPSWSLSQVLLATGGRFVGGSPQAKFRSISTDTRSIEAGDLFLALSGDQFDGLAFVQEAVGKGAAGIIVERLPEPLPPVPVILVEDALNALGDLACYRRSLMRKLQVMAITGSSGKTTVKEMVAAILSQKKRVLKTKGNFNNLVGLPLSLLPVGRQDHVAVLEMGMNQAGEISRLTEIADPDIACITNVQEAHLAGFGNIEGVARAKAELFGGVKSWATLVVNVDDKRIRKFAKKCEQKKITFGRRAQADVRATHILDQGAQGVTFTLHLKGDKSRVSLKAMGIHNVINSLAAAALAHAAGLRLTTIVKGLESFQGFDKRLQTKVLGNGLHLVNDTYNANPASMLAALETVHGAGRGHKTIAVLGDMLELGQHSRASHVSIGESSARLGYDYLLTIGEFAKDIVEGALGAGMASGQAKMFGDKGSLVKFLSALIVDGEIGSDDWLLVKGSRGMRMETIINELENVVQGDAV
ncbi:MAG: UDP-N-acetylmuramoyl-tripeptide--D-alanyl-D-alanine ligase [Desulfobulbaceae bacterium]|nr:UDP-N-acetylmuramoyl-tripeptide--D-alanyl-D-alanine ligase [Desulfobulbaceae bacterium]